MLVVTPTFQHKQDVLTKFIICFNEILQDIIDFGRKKEIFS